MCNNVCGTEHSIEAAIARPHTLIAVYLCYAECHHDNANIYAKASSPAVIIGREGALCLEGVSMSTLLSAWSTVSLVAILLLRASYIGAGPQDLF